MAKVPGSPIVGAGAGLAPRPEPLPRPDRRPPRVVIVGGGFAGAYCAQRLEREVRGTGTEVWLLDRNNYFVFYPLLVEAGTGSLEPRHAVVSLRSFLSRTQFRMAEVLGLEPDARRVHYRLVGQEDHSFLEYDELVIALGSVTRLPPVPGLREHGFQLKSLADAIELRDRAIRMLELAAGIPDPTQRSKLLHFVVVGANFTGVEVAGEFLVFLREACRHYPGLDPSECRVTLVEREGRILGALDAGLAEYARLQMERRGMRILLGTTVAEIQAEAIVLEGGSTLETVTTIWCAGIAPPDLLRELGLPLDPLGYVVCTPEQRVADVDHIWAIGDCAVQRDVHGRPLPATAQRAVREGVHLAGNLRRVLAGEAPRPFRYHEVGALAALGCRTAVARVFGIRLSGFPAWFLWRTIYLLKMPGWSRRFRIALDWTADLVFRRDYVQLGLHRRPGSGVVARSSPREPRTDAAIADPF